MRALDPTLDNLQQLATQRRPGFKVLIFDLRSTQNEVAPTTIRDVVLNQVSGIALPAIVGPLDFTDHVLEYSLVENGGDWVDSVIAASELQLVVSDPSGELDPLKNPAPDDGRWLRSGNVVVVIEGDTQVSSTLWPTVFTGFLVGQAGVDRARTTGESIIRCSAVSRDALYLRQVLTSKNHPQGTAYNLIIDSLARDDMGLTTEELAFPGIFATQLTSHRSTQLVDESPLVGIAKVLFVSGQLPRFDGYGRLGLTDGQVTKGVARVYGDDEILIEIARPQTSEDGVNSVRILGLDPDLSQVVQTRQVLARASITTGFFSQDASIPVKWSEDGTLQARNTKLEVISSVAAGLFNFGTESYTEATQSDGNCVSGTIKVQGGIVIGLALISSMIATWASLVNTPEPTAGAPAGTVVRPNGKSIAEAVIQQAIVSALSTVGRGQYEVTGEPVEYVFKEISHVERTKALNLGFLEEEREVEIKNDLLNSVAAVQAAASRVLQRERKKQNVRRVKMLPDLRLEPDDIFQTADGRRYMIRSIARTFRRRGEYVAEVDCFEVTAGVRP